MKGKKSALELKTIVAAILVVVFIIGCIFLVRAIGQLADERAKRDTCRDSLRLSAIKLEGLADKFGNEVDIKCYTEYENYRTQDETEIKEIIANKMVECWDLYGKGEMEVFNTEDNSYCVVCSRLTFDKKTELEGFTSYLATATAPYKKMSYMEYMSGVSIEDYDASEYENSDIRGLDKLPLNEPIAVMFTMSKNANPDAWKGVEQTKVISTGSGSAIGAGVGLGVTVVAGILLAAGTVSCPFTGGAGCFAAVAAASVITGGVAGGTIGYFAGASRTADWDAKIVVWPYDRINELGCTSLEGKTGHLEIRQAD